MDGGRKEGGRDGGMEEGRREKRGRRNELLVGGLKIMTVCLAPTSKLLTSSSSSLPSPQTSPFPLSSLTGSCSVHKPSFFGLLI